MVTCAATGPDAVAKSMADAAAKSSLFIPIIPSTTLHDELEHLLRKKY